MGGRKVWVVVLLAVGLLFAVGSAAGAPGALDSSFGGAGLVTTDFGALAVARALVLQPDGKLVAVGEAGGKFALARYNPDGSLDASFGSGGTVVQTSIGTGIAIAHAAVLQPDGKIIVAGSSTTPAGVFTLARYNANGSLDSTFGSGGVVTTTVGTTDDDVYAIALQPDGKIVVGGSASHGTEFALARYNADGSLDTSFGIGGTVLTPAGANIDALALQPDGKILAAGNSYASSRSVWTLARYDSDGSLDGGFGSGGIVTTPVGSWSGANDLVLQPDGKILAVGAGGDGTTEEFAVAHYNSDGSLDTNFGSGGVTETPIGGGSGTATQAALQPDGRLVVGGANTVGSTESFALARYNSDGSLDTSFGSNGIVTTTIGTEAGANALALQPDGKTVLAGSAVLGNGEPDRFELARYLGSTLTVQRSGTGTGTTTSNPSGISCDGACSAPFATVPVTLTATPAPGSVFTGWSGGGCSGTGTCVVEMSADRSVTAAFSLISEPLTIVMAGTGWGLVTASGQEAECGSTCSYSYAYGTTVTLAATPASGSTFKGWSGACTGTGGCVLTMKQAQSATAMFARNPKPACVVPTLKGKRLTIARRLIKKAHCRTGTTKSSYSKVTKGRVISQTPRPRRHLRNGAKVNLVISKGKRP